MDMPIQASSATGMDQIAYQAHEVMNECMK
jgi:hypothetical protein